jgi:hypothetical protein
MHNTNTLQQAQNMHKLAMITPRTEGTQPVSKFGLGAYQLRNSVRGRETQTEREPVDDEMRPTASGLHTYLGMLVFKIGERERRDEDQGEG